MARMQSRLSQASSHRRGNRLLGARSSPLKPISGSTSNPFGISRIRERAGSVFSPKKRRDTTATKTSVPTTEDNAESEVHGNSGRRRTVDSRTGDVVEPGTDINDDLEGGDTFGGGFGFAKTGQPPRGGPTV